MFQSIGFIGTGHMGSALARAAAKGAAGAPVYLSNRTPEKAKKLAMELDAKLSDNRTVAQQCQIIFLAVKPQVMARVLKDLAPTLAARKAKWVCPEPKVKTGYLARYARQVTSAARGAVLE